MKKQTLKFNKYIRYISLNKFLMCYFGVDINNIFENELTHEDAKKIIPNLKITSCNKINTELFLRNIILVKDFKGDILPYEIPELNEDLEVKNEVKEKIEVTKDKETIRSELINDLKIYELIIMKKKCKNCREYREVQKLIEVKKDRETRQYKLKKEKLKRDDSYGEY